MHETTVEGVQLDICDGCGGVWFDADELKQLLRRGPSVLLEVKSKAPAGQKQAGDSHLMCPKDSVVMETYHYLYSSPIILHTCAVCDGIFVEADQLEDMEHALESAHAPSKTDGAEALAEFAAAHEGEMHRQRGIRILFQTLSQFSPGWFA
jgi:Zn-finger nucleic acid-binding protein